MTKKTRILTTIIALSMIVTMIFSVSCTGDPTTATMHLRLSTSDVLGKSIVPSGVPLDVTQYVVRGEGPQGSSFTVESKNAMLSVDGLQIGSWKLSAVGRNSNGIDLVTGDTDFQLTQNPTTATITLNQLVGSGTMRIYFSWDPGRIQNPSLELELTEQGGQRTTVTPTSSDLTAGTAIYEAQYPAGSYTIQARLRSDETVAAGCAEAIRIIGNKVTEGTVTLDLDEYPDSPGTLRLINKLGTPIDCTITGLSAQLPALQDTTATLLIPDQPDSSELSVTWYLDGIKQESGTTFRFSPKAGEHRVDVVVEGSMLASAGSASYPFRAEITGTAGVPIPVAEIEDGTGGLHLSGSTKVAFLPDGRILLGNSGADTLQLARLVRDNVQLLETFTDSSSYHTVDISDILVVPESDLVVTAEAKEPGVTLYRYDEATTSLTKKFHRNGTLSSSKSFSSTGNLFLDREKNIVFAIDPKGCYAAGNNLGAVSESEWPYGWKKWVGSSEVPFTRGTAAVTSPGNQHLAVISTTENALQIMHRNSLGDFGNSCHLNYASGKVTGLSEVRAVAFSDDLDVVTGSEHLVTRFTFIGDKRWEQAQTIKTGTPSSVRAIEDVEQILLHPNGTYLYVIASGSKNVNCFTMSSDGTLNHIGEMDCGTFAPTCGAISLNGEYLVLTSQTNSKLLLCRIPR